MWKGAEARLFWEGVGEEAIRNDTEDCEKMERYPACLRSNHFKTA